MHSTRATLAMAAILFGVSLFDLFAVAPWNRTGRLLGLGWGDGYHAPARHHMQEPWGAVHGNWPAEPPADGRRHHESLPPARSW